MTSTMTDNELDKEWKPSGRPQSTMARSFSLALNDLFKIDNSLADLDAAVSEKKKALSSQESELEALEARLKATEERLKLAGLSPSTPTAASFSNANGRSSPSSNGRSSPRLRPSIGDETFSPVRTNQGPKSPLGSEFKDGSRPQMTGGKGMDAYAQNMSMPGGLPPTPGASEGESEPSDSEYVFVGGCTRKNADMGQDGDSPVPEQK